MGLKGRAVHRVTLGDSEYDPRMSPILSENTDFRGFESEKADSFLTRRQPLQSPFSVCFTQRVSTVNNRRTNL